MKKLIGAALAMMVAACSSLGDGSPQEGGANGNDRSSGGDEGEKLLTGAMTISPDGKYVVAPRSGSTLLVDVSAKSVRELALLADRFVFSKTRDVVYAMLKDRTGVVAIDLATGEELWKNTPAFYASDGATLARVTSDDATLVVGDYDRVFFLRATDGEILGTAKVGERPVDIEVLPGDRRAIVVGSTSWATGKPLTPVSLVDIAARSSTSIEIPNCASPVTVTRDGARAMISPTFCTPESTESAPQGWTSPDPVSIVDIDAQAGSLRFVKNLPGFGPVAMTSDGRAVAYLDMKRIDRTMFDDPAQIPSSGAPQFHLMTIDPPSMKFALSPIGDVLPRFAPSKDGHSLLVDGSVAMTRSEATAKVTFDGRTLRAEVSVFGDASGSLFGVFDLDTKTYTPFAGPAAALDRFVQLGDGSRVFTLDAASTLGDASLYGVDLSARTAFDLGKQVRDIGILPDGRTLVLRVRLSMTSDRHPREEFCFTLDGTTCSSRVEWVSPVPRPD